MPQIDVLHWNRQKSKSIELPDIIFAGPIKKYLLHEVVKWQLAKRRQGTHKTKTRGEVSGGGKKPLKQKGSGRARQGSIRSPLMKGGGVIFGPSPRNYSYTLSKKVKRAGLRSALSYLVKEKRFYVVSEMASEKGKTKDILKQLQNFGVSKAVLIDSSETLLFKRAIKNLPYFRYYSTKGLNVYDLLKYNTAIVTESALSSIITRCTPDPYHEDQMTKEDVIDNQQNENHQNKQESEEIEKINEDKQGD